ncbi:MAG: hypothetical protein ACJAVT_001631 [Yoonia sp.]|jgi:hypothetical protein
MVVQILIGDGTALSLNQLPEQLQLILTRELGALRRVDRDMVAADAGEFTAELEAVGLTARAVTMVLSLSSPITSAHSSGGPLAQQTRKRAQW